jgi:AcrR family transcriptional regulator
MKTLPKSEETRLRILTSALELFHERGFEAATMREIATRAGVATGAAYYYFPSKDAIVLAFYRRAADEMAPQLEKVLSGTTDLRKRLAGLLEVKLSYFEPSRRLLAALAGHVDPTHPLSPFSEQTQEIREQDIAVFEAAISGGNVRVPDDLKASLPRILWMYQMGLILYWIHDGSQSQSKTAALIDGSLRIVVRLIRLSSLPLMRPLRRQVLDLYSGL